MPGTNSGRVPSISGRDYEALLVAYPKEFRRAYGPQMAQVFKDLYREEQRRSGAFGLTRLWVRTLLDLAATALVERSKAMKWKLLMPSALIIGLLIALVDTSPGWDDTGITASALLITSGLLGIVHPVRAWQWALAVGLWIPVLNIAFHQGYPAVIALAFTFAGAYAGKLVRFAIAARA